MSILTFGKPTFVPGGGKFAPVTGGGGVLPPEGFAFMTDQQGNYLTDRCGRFRIVRA